MDSSRTSRYRSIAIRAAAVLTAGVIVMGLTTQTAQARTPDVPATAPAAPPVDSGPQKTAAPAPVKPAAPAPKVITGEQPLKPQADPPNKPLTASQSPTTIVASANRVAYGESTTLTVTIKRSTGSSAVISGTVKAAYVGHVAAAGTVVNGKAVIALPRDWNAGTRRVTMSYSGDTTHGASSAAINITRDKATPVVRASTPRTTYGTAAKVSVTIPRHGNGANPSGTIKAYQGSELLATGTVTNGKGTLTLPAGGSAQTHVVVVKYAGNSNYNAASGSNKVVISKASSALTIDPVSDVISSDRAHISLSVRTLWSYPTGTVTITSSGFPTVTAGLNMAGATVFLAPRKPGTYAVTVRYAGNTNYSSVSKTITVRIKPSTGTVTSFKGNGFHKVGGSGGVTPGLYRATTPAGASCYWERDRDNSFTEAAVIGHRLTKGPALIQITPTDKYVWINGCGTFTLVSQSKNLPYFRKSFPGNGTFVVGRDIAPGHYKETTAGCEFQYKRAQTGVSSDFISAWQTSGATDIYISPRTYIFETYGCSTWQRIP